MLYYIMLCYIKMHCAILFTFYPVISYDNIVLRCIMLCLSCYITLHYIISYYVAIHIVLCHVMVCDVISFVLHQIVLCLIILL